MPKGTGGFKHDGFFAAELVEYLPACFTGEAGRGVEAQDSDEPYFAVVRVGEDNGSDGVALRAEREPI